MFSPTRLKRSGFTKMIIFTCIVDQKRIQLYFINGSASFGLKYMYITVVQWGRNLGKLYTVCIDIYFLQSG